MFISVNLLVGADISPYSVANDDAHHFTHLLLTTASFMNVLLTSMLTGLIYSRFAMPTVRCRWSKKAVVMTKTASGQRQLVLRIANLRPHSYVYLMCIVGA